MKITVGLSGGVDSAVAALLLKQAGHQIEGVFMKNWEADDDDKHCSAAQDFADAQAVCTRLQIPFRSVNFSAEYWERVFEHFLAEYKAGRTPNPDILCNTEIKFKAFLQDALNRGAEYIATGHYVRSRQAANEVELLKGSDRNKDQSYFLHGLNQQQLARSIFPIGELQKTEVRQIAEQHGFINHAKKDSTGICFIGERKFKNFLSEYLLAQPGLIETFDGEVIGEHDGLMYYTYGQRQGLQIGGRKHAQQAPWYVLDKDIERNVLLVGQGAEHPWLYAQGLMCQPIHWISGEIPNFPFACKAKTRYRQEDQHCLINQTSANSYCVVFSDKQRAITPGQSVVFYQNNICLGGAIIESIIR